MTGTAQPDNDDNFNTSKVSLLKRASTFISHCWMKFASQFYRPKPKRRSRRLMGLGPELQGEEARKRTRRGVKANGTNNSSSPESPNMEEQDVDIAEMITR